MTDSSPRKSIKAIFGVDDFIADIEKEIGFDNIPTPTGYYVLVAIVNMWRGAGIGVIIKVGADAFKGSIFTRNDMRMGLGDLVTNVDVDCHTNFTIKGVRMVLINDVWAARSGIRRLIGGGLECFNLCDEEEDNQE